MNQPMKSFLQLEQQLSAWGIVLTPDQEKKLFRYYELLIERNQVMNLTTITEWEEVCTKHFLDSAALCCDELHMDFQGKHLIDIGTGAGFPGIVLKILNNGLNVTLLDALSKRVGFLQDVVADLQLNNVSRETLLQHDVGSVLNKQTLHGDCRAVHGRAEEIASYKKIIRKNSVNIDDQSDVIEIGEGREVFDYVTARAVAGLNVLCEYALPLLKTGGMFCTYKSADIDHELIRSEKAIKILGGQITCVYKYTLPKTDICRSLILITKTQSSPHTYPRHNNMIKKKPI